MTAAERFVKRMLVGETSEEKTKETTEIAEVLPQGDASESVSIMEEGAKEQRDKAWRESALDVAIEYLQDPANDAVKPNVFSKKWAVKKGTEEGKSNGKKPRKTAQDSLCDALVADESPEDKTLQEHDEERHPDGFNPETDTCKFRERIATETEEDKGDILDSDKSKESPKGHKESSISEESKSQSAEEKPKAKVYEGLSKKKVEKYKGLMAKKHPELDADLILTELAKIKDPKLQGDAFAWVMKGAIKLPEDMYKVEQARELATKAKRDPLQWDTPQACINELMGKGHKIKEKPITVEELKKNSLMSDYRDEGYGVETFQVDDSREGQKLMRQVIDTHWGKDANPWCLLARGGSQEDEEFENWFYGLSAEEKNKYGKTDIFNEDNSDEYVEGIEDAMIAAREYFDKNLRTPDYEASLNNAWSFWRKYNALPKRVAFKDGKLLAFMATENPDKPTSEDIYNSRPDLVKEYEYFRQAPNDEIPLPFFSMRSHMDFYSWVNRYHPEAYDEFEVAEQWWDRMDKPHKGIPIGKMDIPNDSELRKGEGELHNGKLSFSTKEKTYEDGRCVKWGDNDTIFEVNFPDKTEIVYSPEGRVIWLRLPWKYKHSTAFGKERIEEGTTATPEGKIHFVRNGKPFYDRQEDGAIVMWYENGRKRFEKTVDGTERFFDESGKLISESSHKGDNSSERISKTCQDELVIALIGENYVEDADMLPQGETLEEHDRKKHKGHFDPSTQTCKYRDEMKKETETDKADIVDEDRDSGGSEKKSPITPEEDSEFAELASRIEGLLDRNEKIPQEIKAHQDKALKREVSWDDFFKARKELNDEFAKNNDSIAKLTKKIEKKFRQAASKAFPNTKVVGKDGLPLMVFHGTVRPRKDMFTVFSDRPIFTFKREDLASQYTHSRRDMWVSPDRTGHVIPMVMNLENPLEIDAGKRLWSNIKVDWSDEPVDTEAICKYAKEHGHDGVIIHNVRDNMFDNERASGDEYIAFSSNQVKACGGIYTMEEGNGFSHDYEVLVSGAGNTYDDSGNVVPLSRRFDDGDDIRGDVSGSTSSGSGGEEFGESFYAEVYPDRRQSYSAEFGTDEAEETAEAAYKANFTRDGQYKMPFEGGKFSRRILDTAKKPKKEPQGNSDTITLPSGRKIPATQKYLHTDTKGNLHDEMWSVFLEKQTGDGAVSKEFSDVVEGLFSGRDFDADAIKALPEWKRAMEREQEIQRDLQETHGVSSTIDINTEDREQFREAIMKAAMSDHISKTVPIEGTDSEFETNEGLEEGESYDVEKGRNICIVIGLPAAGKSTSFANPLAKRFKARLCDSDTIKKVLPEFNNGYGGNLVHEESTKLNEEILERSIEQGDNIVYPILGYKPEKLEALFKRLREKEYKINLCLKDMPANIAKGRLLGRFLSKGRYLPIECITKAQGKFADCFERVKGLVDAYVRATSDIDGSNERIIEQKGDLI